MSRTNNIKYGNKADGKIIKYLSGCRGIYAIQKIGDYQTDKYQRELKPTEWMHNSMNQYLGVDYMIITEGTKYKFQNLGGKYEKLNGLGFDIVNVDTKGFNYNPKYYGALDNGIVETMLLQVEKCYGGNLYYGWANNPNHLTTHLVILINDYMYFVDYKSLVGYCKRFDRNSKELIPPFNKGYGNYELCIKASVRDMVENKVITNIIPIS
ncbi:MAG: hypothetical protein RSD36_17445 [Terrisporobacter sp.]